MKKQSFYIRYFRCPICNSSRQATKRSSHKTAIGHQKRMFCFKCGREQEFIQVE